MVRRAIMMIYLGARRLRIHNRSSVYTVRMKGAFQKKEFYFINKAIVGNIFENCVSSTY